MFASLATFGAVIADVIPKPILGDYEFGISYISPIVFVTIVFMINAIIFSVWKKSEQRITKNHAITLIVSGISESLGI